MAHDVGPFDFATQDISTTMDHTVVADSPAEARQRVIAKFGSEFLHATGMQDMAGENDPLSELGLPEIIEIEQIHSCNLRCLMCNVTYEKLAKECIDVDKLVEQLQGLDGRWALISTSYEPCVHPHFGRLTELPLVLYDTELKVIQKRIAWKLLGNLVSLGLHGRRQTGTSSLRDM